MNGGGAAFGNLRARARRFFVFTALLLAAGPGSARVVNLTALNTSDLHGTLNVEAGGRGGGSLLQCATLVRQVRAENPNTLLLDCGDIFQGSAVSYLSRGGVMATAMNAMGYDAFTIGNHEFDWGVDTLAGFLGRMAAPPLVANLQAGPEAPAAFRRIQPYLIKELDGVKVAIVGLTTPNIPNWTRGVVEHDLQFLDSRRALENILPQVRAEQPQVLILLVHQGLLVEDDVANQLNAIGQRFGEFDLVLGGHLHAQVSGQRVGKVDYGQADSYASGVLRVDLAYDTVAGAVVDKKFEFLPVTGRVRPDADIAAQVAPDQAKADEWLATVVGTAKTNMEFSVAVPGLCPIQQLLCAAIAEKTGAEVVLHDTLSDESLWAGEIRVADVWRIVPFENTAGCLWLTLGEIREIMEESATYLGTDRYFGAWGLQYEVHPNAPEGRRIRNLRAADGSAINGKRRLKVALNSYHLAGGGGRFPAIVKAVASPNCRLEMADGAVRDMVIDYIRRHRSIGFPAGTNATVVLTEPRGWHLRF